MFGIKIIPSESMVIEKKIRRKTHKMKRIDKKYLKKFGYKNILLPIETPYFLNQNTIMCHPKSIGKILKNLEVE